MIVFFTTIEALLLFFGIGFVGFYIMAKKKVPANVLDVLGPLVIDIGLPCLVFGKIIEGFDSQAMPYWWKMPLWWLGFTLATTGGVFAVRIFLPSKWRSEFCLSLLFPNGIFIPLACLIALFGVDSQMQTYLFLFTLFFPAFVFNTYWLFYKGVQRRFDYKKLFNPVMMATFIALVLRLTHLDGYVPDLLIEICRRLGQITLPLLMMLIGGVIYLDTQNKTKLYWGVVGLFVLIKNLMFPALTLLFVWWFKPAPPVAVLLLLTSAVPPVTAAPVLVKRAGGNASLANQFLIVSFVASLVSIPVVMWILSLWYEF